MKIVTKKQMRYDELIKAVFEGRIDVSDGHYFCDTQDAHMIVSDGGVFSNYRYTSADAFTVEVEEELSEETEIQGATLIYYSKLSREIKPFRYADESSPTLKHIKQQRDSTEALAVFIGKQLIWTKDAGIPSEGTLEL